MVDQRNQQLQTVLIATTIMIAAIISVLYEAPFPDSYHEVAFYLFCTTITIAFISLMVSTIVSIELLMRINRFANKRALTSAHHLQKSLQQGNSIDALLTGRFRRKPESGKHRNGQNRVDGGLSSFPPEAIFNEYLSHEEIVRKFFQRRDKLNAELHILIGGRKEESFETFWKQGCRHLNKFTVRAFYAGTFCTVASMITFMFAYFETEYDLRDCSYAISIIIGLSLITFVILVRSFRRDPMMLDLKDEIRRAEEELIQPDEGVMSSSEDFVPPNNELDFDIERNNCKRE